MTFDVKALRRLRDEREMAAEVLSAESGVSVRTIREIERGAQEPKAETLGRLASALGVSTDAFFVDRPRSV